MDQSSLVSELFAAFSHEAATFPSVTLRAGNDCDNYQAASQFDQALDSISDAYLESYHWGIAYLDAPSWRHYLPYLIEYALRHAQDASLVVDALLSSLRPPDREPPRLGSLSPHQDRLVTQFLECLAFGEPSPYQEFACQVLEEWWVPSSLYRSAGE